MADLGPNWCAPDRSLSVTPPVSSGSELRDPDVYERVIRQFFVTTNPRYAPSDLDKNGVRETWCNLFVSDVTAALGCPVPRVYTKGSAFRWVTADEQSDWFRRDGFTLHGWRQYDAPNARNRASLGFPTVVCWRSLSVRVPSHIAMVVPHRNAPGLWIAQAGGKCFERGAIEVGFGKLGPLTFWSHD